MPEAILRTKLTGDAAELQRAFKEGMDSAKEFSDSVSDSIKETLLQVTGLVIGFESIREVIDKAFEGVKGVFEMSKELEHLSDRTGIATKDLVQLQTEFKLSGLQAEEVGQTINRLQRSIENASDKGGASAEVFQRLGLNIYQLKSLNPAQQFEVLRANIASIENPARRAQVAMQLFGRQGAEMLSLFKNGEVGREAADALGSQATILANNSETFREVAAQMEAAGIRIQGFFIGMADPIGRVILPVLREINSIDLTKWGEKIGNSISGAITIFYNALKQDGGIGDVLDTAFQTAIKAFAAGFKDALIGAAEAFGAEMIQVLAGPIAAFQAVLDYAYTRTHMGEEAEKWSKIVQSDKAVVAIARANYEGIKNVEVSGEPERRAQARLVAQYKEALFNAEKSYVSDRFRLNATLEPGYMSASEYVAKHGADDSATFFGKDRTSLETSSQRHLDSAGKEVGDVVKDAINQLTSKYGAPIPGQGAPNAPEAPRAGGQTDDWTSQEKQIIGFSMGAHGWQGENIWAQGPAQIETGMAGRAGRIIAGPHTVEQNTSEMNQSLKDIHTTLNGIVAPT